MSKQEDRYSDNLKHSCSPCLGTIDMAYVDLCYLIDKNTVANAQ